MAKARMRYFGIVLPMLGALSLALGCPDGTSSDAGPEPEPEPAPSTDGGEMDAGPPPDPFPHPVFGEEGVGLDDGALAGTFGATSISASLVTIPLLGERIGGGYNYLLVERSYDAEANTYSQVTTVCGGKNYTVLGMDGNVLAGAYEDILPSSDEDVEIVHSSGEVRVQKHLQLWGLRNLPDSYSTPLPQDKPTAQNPPWTERIWDQDNDGNPGMTLNVGGPLGMGNAYFFQRKKVQFDGVAKSADRIIGITSTTWESLVVGSDNPAVEETAQGSAVQHPDALLSWFEMKRLEADADCEDVLDAVAQGTLPPGFVDGRMGLKPQEIPF